VIRPRVAFVVQRAGAEVNGGAEYLCLAVARAMSAVWDVEIVTTCARDYTTWQDHYPPGVDDIDGVRVRRFPVDKPRATAVFDKLSRRVLDPLNPPSPRDLDDWMKAQGPYSTPLLRYLEAQHDDVDLFVFFTYLYATTYFGLPLVRDKAVLVPFAHDEWTIRLPLFERLFALPAGFVFSTPEERTFLRGRFPGLPLDGPVVGIGIEPPADVRPERFRERTGVDGPFLLYLGRIDRSKGCERLFDDFAQYRTWFDDDLTLVLAGRAAMDIPEMPGVRALGFVDEATKFDAIAAAEAVVMPSSLESLSIVLLEAWSLSRPVLVTAASDVLVGQTRRANGGLWYEDAAEFAAAAQLLRGPEGAALGACGRAFVEERYRWGAVTAAYEGLLRAHV
jgi:glycosyltransferase involved in cell wall biosynthesis